MKTNMKEFDRESKNVSQIFKEHKYQVTSLLGMIGMAFLLGWLFLIPAIAVVFLTYGAIVYLKERKNRITVTIKPSEAMKAIMRREAELQLEKEKLLNHMVYPK